MIELNNLCLKVNNQLLIDSGNIDIKEGFIHVILGESGSGKTTLLHEISLLSRLSASSYLWNHKRIDTLNETERADIRRIKIGYVMQDLELISDKLTLKENIQCMYAFTHQTYDETAVLKYMSELNLNMPLDEEVIKLSRGERQRFALVLALIKDATLLVCDEPTSALDEENAKEFIEELKFVARTYKKMVIIATHDHLVSEKADCIYRIKNKELLLEKDERKLDVNADDTRERCSIHHDFYHVYKKGSRTVMKSMMNLVYILLMCLLLLAPLVLNQLLDRHEVLYNTLATHEISVKQDYGNHFSTAKINLLKEISYIKDVHIYNELDGYIDISGQVISVKIIPRTDINNYSISKTLSEKIGTQFNLNIVFTDSIHSVSVDGAVNNAYPKKEHIDVEIVYIPINIFNDVLNQKDITSNNMLLLYCDEVENIDEAISEIKRWLPEVEATSETMEYLEEIEMLESIKEYIVFIELAVIGGACAIAYLSVYMENKARSKEITHLRINGLKRKDFYLLYVYENRVVVLSILILTYMGYCFIESSVSFSESVFMSFKIILCLVLTKVIPIFIVVRNIFSKNVSELLRGRF